MKIIGISAFYHDSAAALVVDGRILFAAQEERFTRRKHDPSFPVHAVRACMDHLRKREKREISLNQLDAIVFYDKPFLKFERLLETYYAFAPKGFPQFKSSMPVWIKEKIFFKRLLFKELSKVGEIDEKRVRLLFSSHHLSHAASAFYASSFRDAAILTVDGVGEWATTTIAHGKGGEIRLLKELEFPHSVGLLYSAFTYYTGFKVNSGEYKLMGLAPYGDTSSGRVQRYRDLIRSHLVDIKEDGSIWLNQQYFDYAVGLRMIDEAKWHGLFGLPVRTPETEITQEYCDVALAVQEVTNEILLGLVREARKLTGATRLCMAGGVALNCVANGKLIESGMFDDVWIQPAAGDAGGALGAALAAHHIYFDGTRAACEGIDAMQGSYLGPEFDDLDIELTARRYGAAFERVAGDTLFETTAGLLERGNIVGWFQGRMEFGPRALGNRSIIADARNPEMQKKLNLQIKYRESFRPFAPSVLAEDVAEYFEHGWRSPYMLLIDRLHPRRCNPLPEGYSSRSLLEKLYFLRSDLPAITHLDFTARVQTVHRETNPWFHRLISAFKKRTGCGVIVNTSFNVRGEPIVCTPEDAYRCFMRTEMDYLIMGDHLFAKRDQPAWEEGKDWRKEYALD